LSAPRATPEALVIARSLGQVAAEVDQPHVERAELLGSLRIDPIPLTPILLGSSTSRGHTL
jgi:hypothetical protein